MQGQELWGGETRKAIAVLACSAVGIASLLLWLAFTWSLALTGEPSARAASVAITSFAFMFDDVPEPV